MIEIRDLSFSYRTGEADAVPALRGLDLRVEPGQFVAIIGHNGSGKSTLVKLLCAVLYPTEGEIRIEGIPVSEEGRARLQSVGHAQPVGEHEGVLRELGNHVGESHATQDGLACEGLERTDNRLLRVTRVQ